MKIYLICFIFYAFTATLTFAAEIKYPVASIPADMKKNARSVIRNEETIFSVLDISHATCEVRKVITVLNKNGIDDATFHLYYDKFLKVNGIKATVYDEAGIKIKRLTNEDIIDITAISGFSMYDDNRVKIVDPGIKTVPFTIEIEYTNSYSGLLTYPEWMPYDDYNISVESSSFTVICPKDQTLRYLEKNLAEKVQVKNGDVIQYQWKAQNLQALLSERYSLSFSEYIPIVWTAPADFEIGDSKGNATSWDKFGLWNWTLLNGRNNLSDLRKDFFRNMVKDINDDFEKIGILYRWMQNNTRYVSIKVGLGGWQPFDAETVDRLGYGDCKALANYMCTILETVGIKSYYTLVYAGENQNRVIPKFPMNSFNHVFLCVPLPSDTLWLECTSQQVPCGYLGDFTDDRDVLLITNEGGKLVHTKAYPAEENLVGRKAMVQFDTEGNATAKVKTTYFGAACEEIYPIVYADDADRKKIVLNHIDIPSFDLKTYSYQQKKDRIPLVEENLEMELRNYGTKIASNYLITCNLMNRVEKAPRKDDKRLSDIRISRAYIEVDTITYHIPEGFILQDVPSKITFKTDFGEYTSFLEVNQLGIIYIRHLRIEKGTYSKARFSEFVKFKEDVVKADNLKMVLAVKPII